MDPVSMKEYTYERMGDRFERTVSMYDTNRRINILVDRFLGQDRLNGASALEVGCGLGYFSERMEKCGASVTATDIGPGLVDKTSRRIRGKCEVVDALHLLDHFGENRFDVVLSSDCIEHTRDPEEAVRQMIRVLRPGGYLSLSTPNVVWYPVVKSATLLRLRPYDGHEHFSSWSGLRGLLEPELVIQAEYGLHLLPFQLPLRSMLPWMDEHLQPLRFLMINICILARKKFEG